MIQLNSIKPTEIVSTDVTDWFIQCLKDMDIRVERVKPAFAVHFTDDERTFELRSVLVKDMAFAIDSIKNGNPYVVFVGSVEEVEYVGAGKIEHKLRINIMSSGD